MLTIIKKSAKGIEVNKSKFIAVVGHLDNKDGFASILNEIKKDYPLARHYCYAYVIKDTMKSSDDGEPSGTAGKPLLNLLMTNNLIDSYVVVVRYFGGVKLGASRLLRTYVESANEALKDATYGEIIILNKTHLVLDDNDELFMLNNVKDKCSLYLENIIYNNKIEVDVLSKNELETIIKDVFKGKYDVKDITQIERVVERK